MTEEEKRVLRNARARERYAKDPEYRASKQAYRRAHKEQRNARHRERYATDPQYRTKFEHFRLKTRYGLSAEEYSAMLARQRYACGICERPFVSTPHVDHCHITSWVRGLLCRNCNFGLGYFEDNPTFLFKAALYALRWYLHLLRVFNKEESNMITNDDSGDSNGLRVMRKAILHELRQPFGVDEPPPADKLQAVARALVTKAMAHDVSAIKEVIDRIDGKTPSAPTVNDLQQLVNLYSAVRMPLDA